MLRILLLTTFLLASSLACAPHSPKHAPSRPSVTSPPVTPPAPKDCAPIADNELMTPTECKQSGQDVECEAPVSRTKTEYKCNEPQYKPFVGITGVAKFVNSMECDMETGEWTYDVKDEGKKTKAELLDLLGGAGPLKYFCAY